MPHRGSRPVQQTSAVGAAAAGSRRPAFAPSGPGAQAAATTEGYIADALAMSVCGVVDQRDRESPDTVFDLFRAAVCRLGYDRVALVPVTPAARQALVSPSSSRQRRPTCLNPGCAITRRR